MRNILAAAAAFVSAGNYRQAADELGKLRPGQQGLLGALEVWSQLHEAQGNWGNVDVLCRVMRTDFPNDTLGYTRGAHSLHRQGRAQDAINLLLQCPPALANEPAILNDLARYRGSSDYDLDKISAPLPEVSLVAAT